MLIFAKFLVPVVAGSLAGFLAMYGVVYSQTQPPKTNPASQEILTYGE